MKIIGIIYTGEISNIFSLKNAIHKLGFKTIVINKLNKLKKVDKIIIPGVGTFPTAIKNLKKNNLFNAVKKIKNKYVLGICLGMQIMAEKGFEFKKTNGFGLLKGNIKKIDKILELPHVGFKKTYLKKKDKILKNIKNNTEFYFTHSFELVDYNKKNIIAYVSYKNKNIVAMTKKNNFYGMQFHPEKSGAVGLKILNNFLNL